MLLPAWAPKMFGWFVALFAFSVVLNKPAETFLNPGFLPYVAGSLANVLFLFGIGTFILRVFVHWSWPGRRATVWISGGSFLCALISIWVPLLGDPGGEPSKVRLGFFLWIFSPLLLFVANLASPQEPKRGRR